MGALAGAWSSQPSHLRRSVNCHSVPVPRTPSAHSVFISACSWVKDRSHFQLNKHFPSRVKSSLVLIGVSPPPSSLPSATFCAVGRTKKWRYYLTYYRHGTVIYGICLVKCHAENIYGPLRALRGGGEGDGCGGEASCSTLAKYCTARKLPLPSDGSTVGGQDGRPG